MLMSCDNLNNVRVSYFFYNVLTSYCRMYMRQYEP